MKEKWSFTCFLSILILFSLTLESGCKKKQKTPVRINPPAPEGCTDIDGNKYEAVKIGTQIWLKQDLKTTRYQNGDSIPCTIEDSIWNKLTSGSYCDFVPNFPNYPYGHLYNWYVVHDSRNIAPKGWHIPNDSEWKKLTDFIGGEKGGGDKLKETGTLHWMTPNNGTNEFGFTALGTGIRHNDIGWCGNGYGAWWSSNEYSTTLSSYMTICFISPDFLRSFGNKGAGMAIRCIKD